MHLVFGGTSVLLSIVKHTDEFGFTVVDKGSKVSEIFQTMRKECNTFSSFINPMKINLGNITITVSRKYNETHIRILINLN